MIILDTNVLSELMRPRPSEKVSNWFALHSAMQLFVTTVTEAEIYYGLALLAPGTRRSALEEAAQRMFDEDFAGRRIAFDSAAARAYAEIAAARRQAGRPIHTCDAQIAAITRFHQATLATRNVADFENCGIVLINPWT